MLVVAQRAALDVKNTRIRELEQELEEAVRTESKLRREITGLEAAVQDAEDRSATASLNSAARGQLQHDASNKHAQLDERLTALEQSLLDVSAQAARHFATRTREVAMLEAEKSRAKKLIDHLRVMNTKLMGDLNDARQQATEAQFLRYRLEVRTLSALCYLLEFPVYKPCACVCTGGERSSEDCRGEVYPSSAGA